ncbi:fatty acid oxidation complex subunit alpha FadJ [Catenovulum maritimum]|uniref:enoyl-CoA hydratase n=1 Tax=Catenovulum maritimum TaxID=1513271 RepID=A0A0J8GVP0_9ALTE|nr:fatty acid oxidation complex subunit alpha FadJ [Catenovulum maritimum]KMT66850.1 multifunctional fatty acid oxidation complex subunit alpha [Catenovulum maritimum]
MNRLQHFSLAIDEDQIAVITLNVPDESMNVLSRQTMNEIQTILNEVEKNQQIIGVVLVSGKPDSFIAGADIKMISACKTLNDAEELAKEGQSIFSRVEKAPVPFVAAIHGLCLGGGLEFSLACHYRVATDDDKTQLGLPEVKLGLLPGSGGTQRLPKLVGIQNALDMMLTGKQVRAKSAYKMGLIDDLVPQSILLETAKALILNPNSDTKSVKRSIINKALENNSFGRGLLFDQALKQVEKKTLGNYPAPAKIIDVVKLGVENGHLQGYQAEAHGFAELCMTPESFQLRHLFLATTEQKKEEKLTTEEVRPIKKVAVLGGGLMGGGISYVSAIKAGLPVRLKDIQEQGIVNSLKYSYDLLEQKVKRKFILKSVAQKQLGLITGTTDFSGFKQRDIVVEAVFEDLALKQQMLADVEQACHDETIFASNTSSLPIGDIAANAKRPENVIGLHYFSPVDKMPLVELIPHAETSDSTLATTIQFARKQGKTPIVVKDCAGFYVNRILAIYINEAAHLMLDGEPIDIIDRALVKFGFPVGPLKLLDEVGIDIGTKIIPILTQAYGERFKAPSAFDAIIADGRKGKKNQKGFYNYQANKNLAQQLINKVKPQPAIDESIYDLLNLDPAQRLNQEEVVERCLVQMLNEAARCLEEGVIQSPRDGDIGAVFGIGFPPFLGGPFRYMDSFGISNLVDRLQNFHSRFGERYKPAQILLDYDTEGRSFY